MIKKEKEKEREFLEVECNAYIFHKRKTKDCYFIFDGEILI